MSASVVLGIDVGGTNLRVGVVSDNRVLAESRFEADFSGMCRALPQSDALAGILAALAGAIEQALSAHPQVAAIGIGFPGFIDPKTRQISRSPNLPGLADVDIATPLRERFGLAVVLENDANAAACGEYALLAEKSGSLIYVGLGTGIGGGLVLHGQPYSGDNGVAMEIGHLIVEPGGRQCGCGNKGCVEQYASASGVVRNFLELSGQNLSAAQIAHLAADGDAHAVAAFSMAGEWLAMALAHILKVIDVQNVVIGGGLSASWPLLSASFNSRLQQDLIPAQRGKIKITVSHAGDQAGMIGAAALAVQANSK